MKILNELLDVTKYDNLGDDFREKYSDEIEDLENKREEKEE